MEEILFEELKPTFLFAWKGVRRRDEKEYHSHDGHIEISYVISGRGQYKIDGEVYDVEEFCDVDMNGRKNRFELPDMPLIHTEGELKQRLARIAASIDTENAEQKPGRYFMLRTYLEQMLILIAREQVKPVKYGKGYSFESVSKKYVTEQIINYFEEHYAEKISLDAIAENMYLSPFYISRIFKSETGDTPIHHLINIRLERAMELLKSGSCNSIREVAESVGYEDVYHFSKLFKKKYNVSPSKVRAD